MQVIATQIKEEGGENPSFRVEFTGDRGEVISVLMRRDGQLDRENALARARELLDQVANGEIQPNSAP